MRVPRNIYGRDLADHLMRRWDYREVHQTGSHMILETNEPSAHRIPVPAHKPLKVGTLNGILRAIARHKNVTREDLLRDL